MAEEQTGKHWWQSKTLWGIIGFTVSTFAPKYQPIAEALPAVVQPLGQAVFALFAAYGRVKTDGRPINNPLPQKGDQ